MRRSDNRGSGPARLVAATATLVALAATATLLAGAAGCSPQVLAVVDPAPCTDGGAGCIPTSLLEGLVGYWRLDDSPGSPKAMDSSVSENDGTLHDLNETSAWTAGRSRGGLDIGATGWVQVDPSASIDAIRKQMTISAWIYYEGTIVNWGTAASRQIGDTMDQHYHISLNAFAKPSLFVTTATQPLVLLTAPTAVPRMTWTHLAGTYDGATARLYVDGTLAASHSLTGMFAPDKTPLIIGGNGNFTPDLPPNELFPGRLDEIMLYTRALTDKEIGELHDGALFPPASAPDAGPSD